MYTYIAVLLIKQNYKVSCAQLVRLVISSSILRNPYGDLDSLVLQIHVTITLHMKIWRQS